jgi:hypothetical protein
VSTRSSIASLPALIEGARATLGDRPAVTGFVLPLAVSTFKINTPIADLAGPLFIAQLYGVPLGPAQIATMAALSVAMSFSNPGIPSGGMFARHRARAPLGGAPGRRGSGLLIAADAIPDVFNTGDQRDRRHDGGHGPEPRRRVNVCLVRAAHGAPDWPPARLPLPHLQSPPRVPTMLPPTSAGRPRSPRSRSSSARAPTSPSPRSPPAARRRASPPAGSRTTPAACRRSTSSRRTATSASSTRRTRTATASTRCRRPRSCRPSTGRARRGRTPPTRWCSWPRSGARSPPPRARRSATCARTASAT